MSVSRLKLRNTENYMVGFSKRLIKLLKIEIGRNRQRRYAPTKAFPNGRTINEPIDSTGSLANSLKAQMTKVGLNKSISGGSFSLGVTGNSYGEKVDEGTKQVPDVDELVDWIKSKPVRLRDARGKFITRSDAAIRTIAGLIRRKIRTYGSEPTNFIGDAIEIAMQQINSIAEPIEKDIYLNLDEIFKRAGYTKKGDDYIIE
jgi:hypothetical protein